MLLSAPLTAAFELQRTAVRQTWQTVETGVGFHTAVNDIFARTLQDQQPVQRRVLVLQHIVFHTVCDKLEEDLPAIHVLTGELRDLTDEQFDQLYENHDAFFDTIVGEFNNGVEALDDVSEEYLAALDEHLEAAVRAHEDIEGQSIQTVEQFDEQFGTLQDQVVDLKTSVDPASA